ncbi:MAG: putative PEP-binding protein, partial [Cetobacterium sp.]
SLDPAVLKAVDIVAQAGKKFNKKVSVCGEMAGDEIGALALMSLGIKNLSMIPSSIPKIRNLVRKIEFKKLGQLREKILESLSPKEVKEILEEYLKNL